MVLFNHISGYSIYSLVVSLELILKAITTNHPQIRMGYYNQTASASDLYLIIVWISRLRAGINLGEDIFLYYIHITNNNPTLLIRTWSTSYFNNSTDRFHRNTLRFKINFIKFSSITKIIKILFSRVCISFLC
jgi:hypothetical protein